MWLVLRRLLSHLKGFLWYAGPVLYYWMRDLYYEAMKSLEQIRKKKEVRVNLQSNTDPLSRIDLRPGDVAIDCGANVGDVTTRLAL